MRLAKKKIKELLRSKGINNVHRFVGNGEIHIIRMGAQKHMAISEWLIVGNGFQTNPNGHFSHYGHKAFMILGRKDIKSSLEKAKKWAEKNYGITEWILCPFGTWVSREVCKRRMKELLGHVVNYNS